MRSPRRSPPPAHPDRAARTGTITVVALAEELAGWSAPLDAALSGQGYRVVVADVARGSVADAALVTPEQWPAVRRALRHRNGCRVVVAESGCERHDHARMVETVNGGGAYLCGATPALAAVWLRACL
ncbi:MAG TPA: hypothetical protein VFC99_20590 [Acidimicrobiia bacterium]|nr:hypothetical protein [Acidimicrobiia bacterium]